MIPTTSVTFVMLSESGATMANGLFGPAFGMEYSGTSPRPARGIGADS